MSDLRELVVRWQRGWGLSRALPAAADLGPGLRVRCLQIGRAVEYFALDQDPASLRDLAGRVAAETEVTWLTVPTADPDRTAGLLESAGLVVLKRSELMMTIDLCDHPEPPPAAGYTLRTRAQDAVVTATVHDAAGTTGAHGTIGLAGPDAVADRIETMSAHRRRGLGSTVMGALAAAAVSAGATRGILVASEEGRHLYTKLGWRPAATVLIAATPGTVYPS
ncbi:GNAT family N-acetyltransferase [Dactylosporangium sp. NPDC005555]|uniref:GNAT family N-acetyltransferase n=1 Tax=Dactylosporangium sp. NPDC005555 TaxID=3154889 RepID=UPI00339DD586